MSTLASNIETFRSDMRDAEDENAFLGLRILAKILTALAGIAVVVTVVVAGVALLGGLGGALVSRNVGFGAAAVTGSAIGAFLILLLGLLQALLFWAGAQFIGLMLSIEWHTRRAARLQAHIAAKIGRAD